MAAGPEDLISVDLSQEERRVLRDGLLMWGGPASMTDEIARAIWYADREDFYAGQDPLRAAIEAQAPPFAARLAPGAGCDRVWIHKLGPWGR
jgi:hypothetical protein